MIFSLDPVYSDVAQFAGQMEHVRDELIAWLEQNYDGTRSEDYYMGLLAGYANAMSVVQSMTPDDAKATIGALTAFVAREVRKRQYEKSA